MGAGNAVSYAGSVAGRFADLASLGEPVLVAGVFGAFFLLAWMLMGWSSQEACAWWRAATRLLRGPGRALARQGVRAAKALVARLGIGSDRSRDVTLSEVSEMTDVVRLGLSAGLSFDAALGLYCEYRAGELSEQMARARLSWQMGLYRREDALMEVARATGVRALESFATSVGQALGLGAPLAQTLSDQAREMRAAHRADVERQIERAPVKLLVPTGTLILPALLLSIVGPLLAAGEMI